MVAPLHTNLAAALAQLDGGARQFDVVAACERSPAIDQDFVKARVRRAGALSAVGITPCIWWWALNNTSRPQAFGTTWQA